VVGEVEVVRAVEGHVPFVAKVLLLAENIVNPGRSAKVCPPSLDAR